MAKYRKRKIKLNLKDESFQSSLGVALLVFAALVTLSFFGQAAGAGNFLQDLLNKLFGWGTFLIPILAAISGLVLLRLRIKIPFVEIRTIYGLGLLTIALLGLMHFFIPEESARYEATLGQAGGFTGFYVQLLLRKTFSSVGAFLLLVSGVVVGTLITLNTSIDEALFYLSQIAKKIKELAQEYIWKGKKETDIEVQRKFQQVKEEEEKIPTNEDEELIEVSTPYSSPTTKTVATKRKLEWEYPTLDLLNDPVEGGVERGDIEKNAELIEQTLSSFGINARVADVNLGPTVTQYALEAERGTKLSAITNLSSDLALALASKTGTVRIEAPIPGKSQVGVEVPNPKPGLVTLKEIMKSEEMENNKSKLAVALGRDVSGSPVVDELERMPHALIAGATGSGKSIMMRSMLATVLFRTSPEEVRLILVDPKRVEFSGYNGIPHLLMPVIVEPEKTLPALKWAVGEMGKRYKMLQDAGARDIESYNGKAAEKMPYILIVVDELADIMVVSPAEVEKTITRLAQMARATGIHLLLATQRPSTDVLTGLIKANIPCRIAFNVTSQVDSRVIMDMPGAEKLLGKGDMLYLPPDRSKPTRIQSPFVSNEEMDRLIGFLKNSGWAPDYIEEEIQTMEREVERLGEPTDPLFEEAVEAVTQYERASASLLQRRLSIGYARAARILDELEARGIVGPAEGSKPREVLRRNFEEIP
ncbi:MAG: translocase FtsK protein [candidate division CPR1 bacterium GW2011_GWC1_49_13]|uniref:Translocase FtsK protein n=1 Tax=candidate division CPR1 bacterium GW2011_GWC1_49_13 TaxID=1618342 RepID=A0A0G1VHL3_9BACT|nr:MAG: translocase FtsK protein [candidate division CPR1 bacterium GW2011_GWC1_49_13]